MENPNPSRDILKDVFRPTAEAEQDNYYILQTHDMICQCTHAVSKAAEITHCWLERTMIELFVLLRGVTLKSVAPKSLGASKEVNSTL